MVIDILVCLYNWLPWLDLQGWSHGFPEWSVSAVPTVERVRYIRYHTRVDYNSAKARILDRI